jgi:hypothetical protein
VKIKISLDFFVSFLHQGKNESFRQEIKYQIYGIGIIVLA